METLNVNTSTDTSKTIGLPAEAISHSASNPADAIRAGDEDEDEDEDEGGGEGDEGEEVSTAEAADPAAEAPTPEPPAEPYHFTVNRLDLIREMTVVCRTVEKKTTIPILKNVQLFAAGEWLAIIGTDLEFGYTCLLPAVVHQAGSSTLPARELLRIAKENTGEALELRSHENHWTDIICGAGKMRLAGMSPSSFPELPVSTDPITSIDPQALRGLIEKTSFAISAEESRFALNGALVELGGGLLRMVATDGHRLALATMEQPYHEPPIRFLVPRKAMEELATLAKGTNGKGNGAPASFLLSANEEHLFFQAGLRLLVCRKLTGNFPDYERALPKPETTTAAAVLDAGLLDQVLTRAKGFADERSHAVQFSMGTTEAGSEVRVQASSVERGEFSEGMPAQHVGVDTHMGFNCCYIMDFLKAVKGQPVALLTQNPKSAAEFRIAGREDYRMVLMPMRVD